MIKSKILTYLGWSRPIVVLSVFVSLLLGYLTAEFVIRPNVESIFGLLGLLPFGALGFVVHLMVASTVMSKKKNGLSGPEKIKINTTLKKRRRIYTIAAIINGALGSSLVLYFLFIGADDAFVYLLLTAIYFSVASMIICLVEESYLSQITSYIQDRLSAIDRHKNLSQEHKIARKQLAK